VWPRELSIFEHPLHGALDPLLQLRLADAVRVARGHPAYFGGPAPRSLNAIDNLSPGQLASLTEHHLEDDA
jgi:hypothetical protein